MDVEERVRVLKAASESYYNSGTPLMTDAEYDLLIDELRIADPNNAFLKKVGAAPSGEIFKHIIPVGSQEKLKNREEFDSWIKQVNEASQGQNVTGYVIQFKLDGITIVLYYENGNFIRALTRGDGTKGECISTNVLKMQNVKSNLPQNFTGQLRGEILLPKSVFAQEFAKLGYKNPRNTVAGLSRDQKTTDLQKHFIVKYFDSFGVELKTELDRKELFDQFDLDSVETKFFSNPEELWQAYKQIEENRSSLDFEIDGVIMRAMSLAAQEKMGMSSDLRPRGQRCIKFEAMGAATKLVSVELTIGHTGAIIPTGKLQPVNIGGVTISSVLLNNYDEIRRLDIAVGDTVRVIRAGDVIPKVESVLERPENRQPILPPENCIVCGEPLVVEGASLLCTNEECEGKAIRRIKSWVKKRDIKFLGDDLLERLFEEHGVKEPHQLYALDYEFLSQVKRGEIIYRCPKCGFEGTEEEQRNHETPRKDS